MIGGGCRGRHPGTPLLDGGLVSATVVEADGAPQDQHRFQKQRRKNTRAQEGGIATRIRVLRHHQRSSGCRAKSAAQRRSTIRIKKPGGALAQRARPPRPGGSRHDVCRRERRALQHHVACQRGTAIFLRARAPACRHRPPPHDISDRGSSVVAVSTRVLAGRTV